MELLWFGDMAELLGSYALKARYGSRGRGDMGATCAPGGYVSGAGDPNDRFGVVVRGSCVLELWMRLFYFRVTG